VRTRLLRLLACLTLALALAGCGGEAEQDDGRTALTGAQVADEFQRETGRGLEEAASQDPSWEQLSYGLDPAPDVLRRYGIFTVYVVEPGNGEALRSLLADKATGEPLAADADGIRWELDSLSKTWIAYKRYGANVVLAWFSERKQRATDERFARIDRILSGLGA
jgi:hypothetical protein